MTVKLLRVLLQLLESDHRAVILTDGNRHYFIDDVVQDDKNPYVYLKIVAE